MEIRGEYGALRSILGRNMAKCRTRMETLPGQSKSFQMQKRSVTRSAARLRSQLYNCTGSRTELGSIQTLGHLCTSLPLSQHKFCEAEAEEGLGILPQYILHVYLG